jgi:hypothetical protein
MSNKINQEHRRALRTTLLDSSPKGRAIDANREMKKGKASGRAVERF